MEVGVCYEKPSSLFGFALYPLSSCAGLPRIISQQDGCYTENKRIQYVCHEGVVRVKHTSKPLLYNSSKGPIARMCALNIPLSLMENGRGEAEGSIGAAIPDVCIHAHTYIHTYIHIYIHTYIHTYIHIYLPTYIHTYISTYIHTYISTYLHTYIRTHLHIQTSAHSCIHTYTCVHISTCIPSMMTAIVAEEL